MFNLSKQKCPICKMELKEGEEYPEGYGKKFCSDSCKEEYRKTLEEKQPKSSECCCC